MTLSTGPGRGAGSLNGTVSVLRAVAGWVVLAALAGCATMGAPGGPIAGDGEPPWRIPSDAYPTQRLYRLHVDSAEDDGTLRLTLRLERPDGYRLVIADRLGRNLYTVDVRDGRGWLLDHRERRACRITRWTALRGVPLEPLAPEVIPALLLGRVPATPVAEPEEEADGRLSFRDAEGRRWTVERDLGATVGWSRWEEGEPVLWWQWADGEALLSDRNRGVQMRWREIAAEPFDGELPPAEAPSGYTRGGCADGGPVPDGEGI